MRIFASPLALAVFCALLALHAVTVFAPGIFSKLSAYFNIALHVLFLPVLMLGEFTIEESVLLYMASVFFYTLLHYVKFFFLDKKKNAPSDGEEETK